MTQSGGNRGGNRGEKPGNSRRRYYDVSNPTFPVRAITCAPACDCWCRGLPVWSVRRGVVWRLRCRSKRAERWQGAGGICWVARADRYARLLPIARMQLPKWVPAEAIRTVSVDMNPLWCEYVVSARVSTRQCLVQLQGSVRCNVGGIWTCLRNHRSMAESRMSP